MKLKKILACGMAITMLASASIANAALTLIENEDYGYVATSVPSRDEILAKTPSLSVKATKLETQSDVKSLSSLVWSNKHKIENFDVYKIDFTFSNLGDLFNGFDNNENSAICGIAFAEVDLTTAEISNDNLVISKPTGASTASCTYNNKKIVTYVQYAPTNPYPYLDTDNYTYAKTTNSESMKFTALAAVSQGASLDFSKVECNLTYTVNNENTELHEIGNSVNGKVAIASDKIGITAEQIEATANGYVWKVDLENAASITEFKATFKKSGEENAVRKIRNISDLTTAIGGKGTYSFNVGLLTKKTGVTAQFDVKDGTSSAVWPTAD